MGGFVFGLWIVLAVAVLVWRFPDGIASTVPDYRVASSPSPVHTCYTSDRCTLRMSIPLFAHTCHILGQVEDHLCRASRVESMLPPTPTSPDHSKDAQLVVVVVVVA